MMAVRRRVSQMVSSWRASGREQEDASGREQEDAVDDDEVGAKGTESGARDRFHVGFDVGSVDEEEQTDSCGDEVEVEQDRGGTRVHDGLCPRGEAGEEGRRGDDASAIAVGPVKRHRGVLTT